MPLRLQDISYQTLYFGANSCSNAVATYLYPGHYPAAATNTETSSFLIIRVPTGKTATLSNLRLVCHTGPATQGSTVTIRTRASGGGSGAFSASALTMALATSGTAASDDTHSVTVVDGQCISIEVSPTGGQTTGPTNGVFACVLLTIR